MPDDLVQKPDPAAAEAAGKPHGVLDRTLAILELLSRNAGGMQLSAVSAQLGIPHSATHRLLSELVERGYVRQERGHGDYQLTMRLVSIAFGYLAGTGITDIAQPILDRLAATSGELVRLAVVDGDRLTWVAKSQGALSGLRYDPETGTDARLSCTANGHAWLATMDDAAALALVARQGYGKRVDFGPRAPETPKALLGYLRAARRRGYAIAIQTFAPWMAAMAAPIRHRNSGEVRGTVSIAGPNPRLTEARMLELAPELLSAASELSAASVGSPALSRAPLRGGSIFGDPAR